MSNDPSSEKYPTKYSSYPCPEAEYQEILQDPDFFLQKLESFHIFYGTKFRVPTIGGKHLDLHQLFVEVTSRGGIETVISDRRWKEITGAFTFPSSITNASFVLRKFYLSLLYHFEQVYYFRKEEPSIALPVGPILEDGVFVTGTIDGKFDYGYLITVSMGSEELKGVLYHVPEEPNLSRGLSPFGDMVRHSRKKNQLASKDPARPKRNRSGYTFFFAEQYHRLQPSYHGQERGISKKIGQLWSELSEAEKQVYQEKGQRDKERYKAEMLDYKSSHDVQAH